MAGKAGSLLIDIAANTADLKKTLDGAQQDLSAFGNAVAGIAKGLAGGLTALISIDKIKAFADEVARTGVAAQEAANRYKLTSEQVQALEAISRRTGQSMDELAKIGKENVGWLEQVTDEAKRAGQVMDTEYTAALKRMSDESEEANKRLMVLFAPAVTATKSWIADAIERIANDLDAVAQHRGLIDTLLALGRMLTFSGSTGSAQDFQLGERVEAARSAAAELAQMESQQQQNALGMAYPVDPAKLEEVRRRAEDAAIALGQYRDAQNRAGYGGMMTPTLSVATPLGGGGGASAGVDRYAQAMEALRAQIEAANAGIIEFGKNSGLATKEAERRAQLEIDIAKAQALAVRQGDTSDPTKVAALKEAAEAAVRAKYALAELIATQKTADSVNEEYGDGAKKLADQMFYLEKAYAAGKIGLVEYNAAVNDYRKAATEQADLNLGLQGGATGLFGGFMSGVHGLNDQLAEFKLGQQAFTDGFRLMQDAISEFVQTGTIDFGKLAQSFAAMLANMAAQWAAQQIFKAVGAGLGSLFGSSGVTPPVLSDTGGFGPGRASGGDVFAGQSYTVGERGPERFVPSVAGRIEPNGSSGVSVVINNYSDTRVSASKSKSPGGGSQIDIMVEAVENKMAARTSRGQGSFGRAIEGRYGLQPVAR